MTITKVLTWSRLDPTGHVAIAAGENYYSFHPRNPDDVKTVTGSQAYNGSPERDGRPSSSISIAGLDELEMAEQMDRFESQMRSGQLRYRLLGTNCSYIAARLLYAGAKLPFPDHKSISQLLSAMSEHRRFHYDHGRLLEVAREFIEDAALICARRGRVVGSAAEVTLGLLLLADVTTREFVWSPGDVQRLAADFAKRLGDGSAHSGHYS